MQNTTQVKNSILDSESWIKFRGDHIKSNTLSESSEHKALFSLLLSYVLDGDQKMGQKIASLISRAIYDVLNYLKSQPDPDAAINEILNQFDPNHPERLFSACPETQNKLFPKADGDSVYKLGFDGYSKDLEALEEFGAKSNKVALALDTTHEPADSIFKNGEFADVVVGQQQAWKKGFVYESVMDVTHGLMVTATRHKKHIYSYQERPVPHGVTMIYDTIKTIRSKGSEVVEIYADRGYYDGRFFGYAYFREFEGQNRQSEPVRLIVPKKYPRDKESKKREIFEDPDYPEIKLSSIQLNHYCEPHLKNLCGYYGVPYSDGYYHIPMVEVVCVKLWDEKKPMTFWTAKRKYAEYRDREKVLNEKIAIAEREYLSYMESIGFKKKKAPNTSGRGCRVKIRIPKQGRLLNELKRLREDLKKVRRKLQILTESVAVICVSMVHDETFHQFCYEWKYRAMRYRERWAIENGFRDIKQYFWMDRRTRKPSVRYSRVIVGMRVYNRWHVARLREMVRKKRRRNPRYIPFDPKIRHLRRRLEREYGQVLSARGYLSRLIESELKILLSGLLKA
jgi:hypothetical protein